MRVTEQDDSELLRADDTAVIEEAATRLVYAQHVPSMALVCEALASDPDPEVGEEILNVLSPAWESGEVDVPALLLAVEAQVGGAAGKGADEALRWLGIRA